MQMSSYHHEMQPGEKGKIVTAAGKVYDCMVRELSVDYGYTVTTRSSFSGVCLGPPEEMSDKEFAMEVLGLKTTKEDLVRILFQAYFGCANKDELRGILRGCELP